MRDWASVAVRGRLLLSGSIAHASLKTAVPRQRQAEKCRNLGTWEELCRRALYLLITLTGDADAPPEVEVLEVWRVGGDDLEAGVGDARAVGEVEVLQGQRAPMMVSQGGRGGGGGEDGAHRCATCGGRKG